MCATLCVRWNHTKGGKEGSEKFEKDTGATRAHTRPSWEVGGGGVESRGRE